MHSLAIKVLAATCCSRLVVLERRLTPPLPELESPPEMEYSLLGPAQASEYAALVPKASPEQVRRRMSAGDLCFAVRHRGRLVGVSWASTGRVRMPYLRASLLLPPDEAVVDGAFVAPDMRGRHVASAAGAFRLNWLQAAGYRRVIAAILPENASAFGPPKKLGYRLIGIAYGVGLGGLRRMFIALDGDADGQA